jgi:glycosyltransferase involved in cell wall biosynthesis
LAAPLNASSPSASVIVPTRNRRERVLVCLDSLRSQTASHTQYEVVVVDDGSSDGTAESLRHLTPPYGLTVVVQDAAGAAAARNTGAAAARGSILIFVDDDVIASPELVSAHIEAHRDATDVAAVGHVDRVLPPESDRLTRRRGEIWQRHYRRLETKDATFVDYHSGNCSLAAELFHALGGYVPDLPASQDFEFAHRLREAGARFIFVPRASVVEHHDDTSRRIVDESKLRGRTAVELCRRHPPLLPHSALGGVGAPGPRKRRLQSLLIRLRVSPNVVARAGELVPRLRSARQILDFVYDYSFWYGVRQAVDDDLWHRIRSPTIILLYHAFTRPGEGRRRYVVSARRFARQMRWLKWRRYNVISLQSYLDSRREHRLPPRRSVVITLDDGYSDNVAVAGPILERFGFAATIFLVTAAGPTNGWSPHEPGLADRPLISLSDVRGLTGTFDFGAHARTHVRLDEVDLARARSEIVGCKRELEEALDRNVDSFAYPFGAYDAVARDAVKEAGFAGACTVKIGGNARVPIRSSYAGWRSAAAIRCFGSGSHSPA